MPAKAPMIQAGSVFADKRQPLHLLHRPHVAERQPRIDLPTASRMAGIAADGSFRVRTISLISRRGAWSRAT